MSMYHIMSCHRAYVNSLPSLDDLVTKYSVDFPFAIHLLRPTFGPVVAGPMQPSEENVLEAVTRHCPLNAGTYISKDAYYTFWRLSLTDILSCDVCHRYDA